MADIILSTLNARYVHASLGLRYLKANMGELAGQTQLMEFVLGARPLDVVERLLREQPRIIGFGVYIWNVDELTRIVAQLKAVAPEVQVVLGGPEVSYETDAQRICGLADYVITGWGDLSFPALCRQLLAGVIPAAHIIAGVQPDLRDIALPYGEYTDRDLAQRFLYVEASRGCPYKCEFCLSALDRTAWPFDLPELLEELDTLYRRGARHFRFVDRTFNLKAATGAALLDFFLTRAQDGLFLHFEVVPDHLPDALKERLVQFPAGTLQFEVGIQTWDPGVQALISRRQDNAKAETNLRWLREHTNAVIHVDLIAGLPGEDLAGFGAGFDRLRALGPHEIQVGILKRLRGAPIARHAAAHDMRFNPDPPYNVLSTDRISFADMQRISRFARYWEVIGNSGRFQTALPQLLAGQAGPFAAFMGFSDWFYADIRKTHEIALEQLYDGVFRFLTQVRGVAIEAARDALAADYHRTGARGRLPFLDAGTSPQDAGRKGARPLRKVRHLQNGR